MQPKVVQAATSDRFPSPHKSEAARTQAQVHLPQATGLELQWVHTSFQESAQDEMEPEVRRSTW